VKVATGGHGVEPIEAARYTGLERLGVSTQCGFSSTLPSANLTTEDIQQQKLELVAEVANTVW
jgi:methionine synthase II (cobalamin-independent)